MISNVGVLTDGQGKVVKGYQQHHVQPGDIYFREISKCPLSTLDSNSVENLGYQVYMFFENKKALQLVEIILI